MLTCVSLKEPHLMRERAVYDDRVDVRLNLGVRTGLSCGKHRRGSCYGDEEEEEPKFGRLH